MIINLSRRSGYWSSTATIIAKINFCIIQVLKTALSRERNDPNDFDWIKSRTAYAPVENPYCRLIIPSGELSWQAVHLSGSLSSSQQSPLVTDIALRLTTKLASESEHGCDRPILSLPLSSLCSLSSAAHISFQVVRLLLARFNMGVTYGRLCTTDVRSQYNVSKKIDKEIKQDYISASSQVKLLLIGKLIHTLD